MWSRIHLIPLLTAEEDRDLVRRHWADLAREKELLGSETKVYHGTRYALITSLPNITWLYRLWQRDSSDGANCLIYTGLCGLPTL